MSFMKEMVEAVSTNGKGRFLISNTTGRDINANEFLRNANSSCTESKVEEIILACITRLTLRSPT